jgi:hypothetical protein
MLVAIDRIDNLSQIAAISANLGGKCCGLACTLSCLARGIGRMRFNLFFSSFIFFISTFSHENFLSVLLLNLSHRAGFPANKAFSVVLQPVYKTIINILELYAPDRAKAMNFLGNSGK